jgi:CubicO group peptidase (beta-lactamase class C family)
MSRFGTTDLDPTTASRSARSLRLRVGATLAAALLVTACSGSSDDGAVGSTTAPPTTVAATTTTAAPDPNDPRFEEVKARIGELVEENDLNGAGFVIFDREAGIIYEDYWGEFDEDHVSYLASNSKMVTAGVLSRLEDQGLLDLDAPIVDYVDWATDNPDITAAQLLSHSSGLVGLLPDLLYSPYLCQLSGDDLTECGKQVFNTPDDDADVVPPDTEFRYGGGQWQVAGAIAETVSGKSWDELIQETYVEPCGLTTLGYNNHWVQALGVDYPFDLDPADLEPTDNPHMEGGVYTNVRDYTTLMLMHLRGGECPNGRVLSEEAVKKAHTDRLGDVENGSDTGYGIGWWIDEASGRVYNNGAYGAVAWLDEAKGYGAYLVIESNSNVGQAIAAELYDPVEAAALATD